MLRVVFLQPTITALIQASVLLLGLLEIAAKFFSQNKPHQLKQGKILLGVLRLP